MRDEQSSAFWDAAARHVLAVAKCTKCGQATLPPDVTCPHCLTTEPEFTFEPVSGRGHIRSWTIIRRSFLQGFDLPFVLVDVELADVPGLRMIARLLDGPAAKLSLGLAVTAAFEDLTADCSVPAFRLESAA